ncbi:hypothetical protein A2631_03195 [Candidatus Daviesbacteria bacterium RIFCSPHIGHO2_01_FULL_44_29]|uniref:Phosphoglycerate mutase n=1 Tax=Candidatus Daviesbacteria bacterium RIFCSPHIGHO2_02_FULL_43_12 TaxID=1797776 RepID=A0A1F5KKP8_9BACT|nr:MAG: hypothetical protein A2631_03195 [Candidatus Daviesbacteria bacterium RIFCSPHIGHO2_01_FULL_44_29]OGE40310.1 MAG: hypothetical protein A3E86_03890 [Candidatus Daviesbacteria bacterium RIFCSPHIGHO2_12_FULL_47_45]OGE41390.1 MAG: hypothetical protein A3D25_02590 [Candidatus Daviesbacteria bacterium RIFCSPHIGHO2_02_FULL_43_12]OGE69591.1 MAG: hypothetical protein A3B55_04335 [Candidatus Daviesbacteria bacterium RIFCSPLOWO2_01_FULL_43_15]
MRVYFVRHGESTHNASAMHQHPLVQLSKAGSRQAEIVADRLTRLPVEIIFSSPHTRAKATAEIIAAKISKKLNLSDLLGEIKWPSELESMEHTNPESKRIRNLLDAHGDDPDWHFSDEENFFEIRNRATLALKMLESRNEENILVVSHGNLIKMLICVMMLDGNILPEFYRRAKLFLKTKNTGVTVCDFDPEEGWTLLTWNDHAHLG